jgi:hypothetical protein
MVAFEVMSLLLLSFTPPRCRQPKENKVQHVCMPNDQSQD